MSTSQESQSDRPGPVPRRLAIGLTIGAVVLGMVGSLYLAFGAYRLAVARQGPGDLFNLWAMVRYTARGENPYAVAALAETEKHGEPRPSWVPEDITIDPEIGPARGLPYPPWALFTSLLVVPPTGLQLARVYFTLCNVVSLGLIALWAYRRTRQFGMPAAFFMATGVLAIFANFVTFRVGQTSIIVTFLLLGMAWFEDRGSRWSSGLMLGLAALKPHTSALFVMIHLVRRRWKSIAAASLYLVAVTLLTSAYLGVGPLEMLREMTSRLDRRSATAQMGLLEPLVRMGMSWNAAMVLGLVLGAVAAAALIFRYRAKSTLTLMAVAAVVGQMWTYHRRYDQVVIVFLLLALGRIALARRSFWPVAAFLAVGLSLWCPHRDKDWVGWVPMAQYATWIFGLVVALYYDRPFSDADPIEQ